MMIFHGRLILLILLSQSVAFSQEKATLNLPQYKSRFLVPHPAGKTVVTSSGHSLSSWDIRSGRCIRQRTFSFALSKIQVSAGLKYILLSGRGANTDTYLELVKFETFESICILNIDSIVRKINRYSNTTITSMNVNEKTGWLAFTTDNVLGLYEPATKKSSFEEYYGIFLLDGITESGSSWVFTGTDNPKQKKGFWSLHSSSPKKPELKLHLESCQYVAALSTDPFNGDIILISDQKKLGRINPMLNDFIWLPNLPDFYWINTQYFWDQSDRAIIASNEMGCIRYGSGSNEFKRLKLPGELGKYFFVPYDLSKKLYFDNSHEQTSALCTYDSLEWSEKDFHYTAETILSLGSSGMMGFEAIFPTTGGKLLLDDINDRSEFDLSRFSMTSLKRSFPPFYWSTNNPTIFLPELNQCAELIQADLVKNKTTYSLALFNQWGLVDTVIQLITLPNSTDKPHLFSNAVNDSICIIFPVEKKAFIGKPTQSKLSEIILPDSLCQYWPPFGSRGFFLPGQRFLFAADLLIDIDLKEKKSRIIDKCTNSNSTLLAFDSIDQSVIYKITRNYDYHLMKYFSKTGDTTTVTKGYDVSTINFMRSITWNNQPAWVVVKNGGQVELKSRDLSTVLARFSPQPNLSIRDLYVNQIKNQLIFLLADNSMRIFDIPTLKPLVTTYFQEQGRNHAAFAFDTAFRYFMPAAQSPVLNWIINTMPADFSFFDLKYNQPAAILQRVKSTDTAFISLMEKATNTRAKRNQRQLKETSLNDRAFCEIKKELVPLTISDPVIKIPVHLKSGRHEITRWQIFVNGVPLLANSKSLLQKPLKAGRDSSFTYGVELEGGKSSHISIKAFDLNNDPSLSSEIYVYRYRQKGERAKIWYLGIGVSAYNDKRFNLKYAGKDVTDIGNRFMKQVDSYYRGGTLPLTDSLVTKDNIIQGLAWLAEKAKVNDIVIISLSGHGKTSKKTGKFHFMLHDTDFRDPENSSLDFDLLFEALKLLPCRQKLLLLDACESGDYDREGFINNQQPAAQLIVDTSGIRGFKLKRPDTKPTTYLDLMKEYFVDLEAESGATIIAATSGTNVALENDTWQNGVFSYAFMQAIFGFRADYNGDKKVSISELKDYITETVIKLTNGIQHPSVRNMDLRNDWPIIERSAVKMEK